MAISSVTLAVIGLVLAIVLFFSRLLEIKVDPREPPVVHPRIPYIGHIIGFLSSGPLFLKSIRYFHLYYHINPPRLTPKSYSEKCKHPIFTLPMLNGRTYVVTSPALAAAVQRSSSTLDFDSLIAEVFPRLINMNADSQRKLFDAAADPEGKQTLIDRAHDMINPKLVPNMIQDVSEAQLKHFNDYFNSLKDGAEAELFHLVTRELTAASMFTFWGPNNPFALHPELNDAFWTWERGNVAYMVNILPKITARAAYNGIEACVAGFLEYLEAGRISEAREIIQARQRAHEAYGISITEQARFEIVFAFAVNSNAGITSFWTVNNLFSRPDLLRQVREEIEANALEAPGTISWRKLRDGCPLLNSVYRESSRLVSPMTSARLVLEDTVLADTYLLRKGAVVQIAGGVMHFDGNIWGPDAASFNPHRFLYTPSGTKADASGNVTDSKANTVHPAAFRAFGGGVSLCPGRHFAQMEILSLTALMAMMFEMKPVKAREKVEWDPRRDDRRFPIAVTKPLSSVDMRLRRRKGGEDGKWVVKW